MVCLRSSSSASRTVLKTGGKNSHILRGQKRAEKGFPENYFCPKLPLNDIEPMLVKVRKSAKNANQSSNRNAQKVLDFIRNGFSKQNKVGTFR